jgi:phosphatidylglycerophosphate synthase
MTPFTHRIPLGLTMLRALLAPVVVIAALAFPHRLLFGACLVLAFLSDVFDGIIARRLNIATANLRRLDSLADSLFYAGATAAAWQLYPQVFRDHAVALLALLALEIARYAFDLAKFGREASYHMWSSKAWGLFLFAGFLSLLGFGETGVPVALAIYVGIAADLEGLAISCVLKAWKADVPSIVHALRLRAAHDRRSSAP